MALFRVFNGKAHPINISKFKNERELQNLVESNLEEIFGLIVIKTEFRIPPFRLDTVAFDTENKAFVIIEYKESQDYSIIDQGYSYLNLLLNHKGDFQLELERKLNKRVNVDWSQSRVIFIARGYNAYQLGALSQNMPFELWRYVLYDDGIIPFEQLKPQFAPSSSLSIGKLAQEVEKEIKVYTIDDHLKNKSNTIKELFENLQQSILKLSPEIKEKVKKHYIAYEVKKNFTELVIQASGIKVHLDIPLTELKDTGKIVQDCTNVGHWQQVTPVSKSIQRTKSLMQWN